MLGHSAGVLQTEGSMRMARNPSLNRPLLGGGGFAPGLHPAPARGPAHAPNSLLSGPGSGLAPQPRDLDDFVVGMAVLHEYRGAGVVVAVGGDPPAARVRFVTGDTHAYKAKSLATGKLQPASGDVPRAKRKHSVRHAPDALNATMPDAAAGAADAAEPMSPSAMGWGGWFQEQIQVVREEAGALVYDSTRPIGQELDASGLLDGPPPDPPDGVPHASAADLALLLRKGMKLSISTPRKNDGLPVVLVTLLGAVAIWGTGESERRNATHWFTHASSPLYDDFDAVSQVEEWNSWLLGPLLTDLWPDPPKPGAYFQQSNRPVGSVVVRQRRVRLEPCEADGALRAFGVAEVCVVGPPAEGDPTGWDGNPFGPWRSDRAVREDFAAGRANATSGERWPPETAMSFSAIVQNDYSPTDMQFSVLIPIPGNQSDAEAVLHSLAGHRESDLWVDASTRLLTVELMVHSVNLDAYLYVQFSSEVTAAGTMQTVRRFFPVWLHRWNWWAWVVEALILLCYITFFWRCLHLLSLRWAFYRSIPRMLTLRNLLSFSLVVCYAISLYRKIILAVNMSKVARADWLHTAEGIAAGRDNDTGTVAWEEIVVLANENRSYDFMMGVTWALSWMRLLFFVEHVPRLDKLSLTLRRASGELVGLIVIFFFIVAGYAGTGYLMFGQEMQDFRTFGVSVQTMLQGGMTGELELLDIHVVSPVTSGIFMWSFLFLAMFCLFNIILAIVSQAYYSVTQESTLPTQELTPAMVLHYVLYRGRREVGKFLATKCGDPCGGRCRSIFPTDETGDDLGELREFKNMGGLHGQRDSSLDLAIELRDTIWLPRNLLGLKLLCATLTSWDRDTEVWLRDAQNDVEAAATFAERARGMSTVNRASKTPRSEAKTPRSPRSPRPGTIPVGAVDLRGHMATLPVVVHRGMDIKDAQWEIIAGFIRHQQRKEDARSEECFDAQFGQRMNSEGGTDPGRSFERAAGSRLDGSLPSLGPPPATLAAIAASLHALHDRLTGIESRLPRHDGIRAKSSIGFGTPHTCE